MIFHFNGYGQDSSAHDLNLKQCMDLAIQNNLQVKQSEIQMQTSGVQFKQSKDNLLPQINASASQGINYGRSINNFNNSMLTSRIIPGIMASMPTCFCSADCSCKMPSAKMRWIMMPAKWTGSNRKIMSP